MTKLTRKRLAAAGMILAVGVAGGVYFTQDRSTKSSPWSPQPATASPPTDVGDYFVAPRAEGEFLLRVSPKRQPQELTLNCPAVLQAPDIDGDGGDRAWSAAESVTTLDYMSQREITLRTVHTADMIFFLVSYPDVSPSTTHRSFRWDAEAEIYKPTNDREDLFVFKWRMDGSGADLSLRGARAHKADIWFWKACRTDPVGYADDKWQSLSEQGDRRARQILTPGQSPMHLIRSGDSGRSSYDAKVPVEYGGTFAPRFTNRQPQGSRADVRARGNWHDGAWTIEFARKLDTGNGDDVAFRIGATYAFIVSCYEIAGAKPNSTWHQPLYRSGDAFDKLVLRITP